MISSPQTLRLLMTGLGLMILTPTAWCAPATPEPQTAPSVAPTVVRQSHTLNALSIAELESDVALQAKVTFTAKSQPLDNLLLDLQTQSKVALVASPESPASAVRVTAYVQGLPLSQVLLGLSRLYGVRWAKTNESDFVMLASDKGPFERGLLQLGNLDEFEGRFLAAQRNSPEHLDWPQEIAKHVNREDLINGWTAPISVIPAELISKIRREKEQMAALRLIEMYQAAMEASVDEYILRVEAAKTVTAPDGKTVSLPTRLLVRTAEGKGVASLNPPAALPTLPVPEGNGKNQPTRNIPGPT